MGERRASIMVAVAALVGLAALPVWRVGIGWPLSALAVAGAAVAVRRRGAPGQGEDSCGPDGGTGARHDGGARADRAWRVAAGVAALLLAAVPAIRAAGWLAALCLAAATLLGSYALAGGRSWRGILAGALAFVPAAAQGVERSTDAPALRWPGRAVASLLAGATLLAVFGSLFAAADPAFGALVRGWVAGIDAGQVARALIGAALVALGARAAIRLTRERGRRDPDTAGRRRSVTLGPLEWAIPLLMLDILFGIFVWLQQRVLFAGAEYVLVPGGPSYAEHARSGFGQLAAVTVLTLAVVATLVLLARRDTTRDRVLFRVLGGLLCGMTLVIVASALKRLSVYADAYGFTVPRLLAFTGEVWLGLVFVLLLAAGVRLRASWLPRVAVAAGVLVLFALVAVNPEAVMARTLLARYYGPYPVDVGYVASLSADAAGEIAKVPPIAACVRARYERDLHEPVPWYALNLSRYRARSVVERYPALEQALPGQNCPE